MQWLQLAAEAGLCVAQLLLRECRQMMMRQAAASLADAVPPLATPLRSAQHAGNADTSLLYTLLPLLLLLRVL